MTAELSKLDEYLRSGQPDEQVHAYEEELFARALADEAPELRFREQLGRTLREMRDRGTISLWLTAREVEEMKKSDLRVVCMDFEEFKTPDLSGEIDILITKVPLDLRGVRRLDAEVLSADGKQLKVMPEITFDPADGAVYACCEIELARTAAAAKTLTKVWAYDDTGKRVLLGELRSG
ncbi:MAG TPA: hypothetical protein VJV78_49150 [Polyangiales bacterium]|nr:hypothetical protein [Polyangiales bacterium]